MGQIFQRLRCRGGIIKFHLKKNNVKVVKVLLKSFVLVNVKSHFVAYCTFKQRRDVPDVDASRFHELTERDL